MRGPSMATCEHIGSCPEPEPEATSDGCPECLANGQHWVHLRKCLICGHVGCCDSSAGRHATAHFHETGHAVMRSAEPGDDWKWCYVHETME